MPTEVDIIGLLERDHRRINGLAKRLGSSVDPDEIRSIYQQLVEALSAHEAIEHEVLFPALRGIFAVCNDRTIGAMMADHEELNCLLAGMRDLDPCGLAFVERGNELLREMERHFGREEGCVFDPTRAAIQPADLIRLAERATVSE